MLCKGLGEMKRTGFSGQADSHRKTQAFILLREKQLYFPTPTYDLNPTL
jgi:hypothetical protein